MLSRGSSSDPARGARLIHCTYALAVLVVRVVRETLESVSLCTRFSGFSTISKFNFDRSS